MLGVGVAEQASLQIVTAVGTAIELTWFHTLLAFFQWWDYPQTFPEISSAGNSRLDLRNDLVLGRFPGIFYKLELNSQIFPVTVTHLYLLLQSSVFKSSAPTFRVVQLA